MITLIILIIVVVVLVALLGGGRRRGGLRDCPALPLVSVMRRAGRIRPLPLLLQQMIGPLAVHMLLRPALTRELGRDLPSVEETCAVFADAFLRAVAVSEAPSGSPSRHTNHLNEPESEV